MVTRIKQLISKGDLQEAFLLLENYSKLQGRKFHNQYILLASRYQKLQTDRLNGVGNGNSELNELRWAILELLDGTFTSKKNQIEIPPPKKQLGIAKIGILGLVITILILSLTAPLSRVSKSRALQKQFSIKTPTTKKILIPLIDSCSYQLNFKGEGKISDKVKVVGKLWHGGEWWINDAEAPILITPDGEWSISFFHGCHFDGNGNREKPSCVESFKFALFLYEEGKQLEDMNHIIDLIEFEAMLKDENCNLP